MRHRLRLSKVKARPPTSPSSSNLRSRKDPMKNRWISRQGVGASIAALMTGILAISVAMAQMDHGSKTEKIYGIGLPRDHASQLFSDKDYPVFPLKPGQEAYKDIDGARMKKDVITLSQIALRYRDTVNKQVVGSLPWHRCRQGRHE